MKERIFLTGGTGFLGSNIAYILLKLGYEVIFLVRKAINITPKERLSSVFKIIDSNFDLDQYCYKIVEGDICLPNLGIDTQNLTRLKKDKPQSIFHCAGSIMFPDPIFLIFLIFL